MFSEAVVGAVVVNEDVVWLVQELMDEVLVASVLESEEVLGSVVIRVLVVVTMLEAEVEEELELPAEVH